MRKAVSRARWCEPACLVAREIQVKLNSKQVARPMPGALIVILGAAALVAAPRPAAASPVAGVLGAHAALLATGGSTGGVPDSLRGRSGKLMARFLGRQSGALAVPAITTYLGDSAARAFALIPLLPFEAKMRDRIGSYRIGYFPAERRTRRSRSYQNPAGFIQVTPENQNMRVSEHFRLRDFLTKDQVQVWPKYLVLREDLIDKLELVIAELRAGGVRVEKLVVMSGFRTPQYNAKGLRRGRAKDSRHQYGDAADVFVDNDNNGWMDDLNRDGRIDTRDVSIIAAAVDRVERRHPELTGGLGRYRATRAHGPFAHIDVRGRRARWG